MPGDEIGEPVDAPEEEPRGSFNRRAFGAKVAVGAAAAWVGPAIISVKAAEACTIPPPPATPPALAVGANTQFITPSLTGPATDVNTITSDTLTRVWAERGPVGLAAGNTVVVDSLLPKGSTFNAIGASQPGGGATITAPTAGVVLYSYFIHVRQLTPTPFPQLSPIYTGSLTVPAGLQVAGIATTSVTTGWGFIPNRTGPATLSTTSAAFSRPNVTYHYSDNLNLDGLENNNHQDTVSLSSDGRTVSWNLEPIDFGGFLPVTNDEFRLFLIPIACP
jgi:hypothetical protein